MPEQMSRRKLLRKGSEAIVAGGVGACAAAVAGAVPATAAVAVPAAATGVDYYEKLGVTPFINAAGTYTILTASIMPDEVQAAVALAAKKPVHLLELHHARVDLLREVDDRRGLAPRQPGTAQLLHRQREHAPRGGRAVEQGEEHREHQTYSPSNRHI